MVSDVPTTISESVPEEFSRILQALLNAQTVCVVGHVTPDGDCIGSQLAMSMALRRLGKRVYCWNADDLPEKLEFLDVEDIVRKPRPGLTFDVVLALDCASFERLGSAGERIKNRQMMVVIDHHQSNTRYGDINWVVESSASTGELVFRFLKYAEWEITPEMANCLFAAISTDTGSFQYRGTTPRTFSIAGELVSCGADVVGVCDEVYQSYPIARIKLLKQVLNNFKLTENNKIAYYWLSPKDFSRSGAEREDSEGLIDHIRAIEPVVVAVQFEEMAPDVIRVSMRSKNPNLDVSEIARLFNGGGHRGASGATIQGTRLSVQRRVIKCLRIALASVKKRGKREEEQ